MSRRIAGIFLDVGGVLLTNGWDRDARARASHHFDLIHTELNRRHAAVVEDYERGDLTLDDYLGHVVFHQSRAFEPYEFRAFMLAQSRPLPGMIDLIRSLRAHHGLKVTLVSNEGRELTEHRLERFRLREIADVFIVSCFVGVRKPSVEMYRLALDVSQSPPSEVVYIDDRKSMTDVAESLGIQSIHHQDFRDTLAALEALGLHRPPEPPPRSMGP